MGNVTRHALRVYAALHELRGNNADVLDSLIPFFDPIFEPLDDTIFNPAVFARGVQHLYGWRFNKDIAEQFIPRLERRGILEKQGVGRDALFLVRYQHPVGEIQDDILGIFELIVDEFERFPPRITDLLSYSRTREQLKDILIRFLVSMDAYNEGALRNQAGRQFEEQGDLPELAEGGTPLLREDRYMAARFVKDLCTRRKEWIPHLARLASIGLLTEVVEDFIKPTQHADRASLTIVVDAPLALDYLGCSGTALQQDVKNIFDSLRAIGCTFVVFPASCVEMQRNLQSMLALPAPKRHGYTHEAMVSGEVLPDFVEAVASNPERALERVGIQIKPLSLAQYPNSHIYFDQERYEDFFASVGWVTEIEPREHDAMCLALIMRLREGRHSSDLFKCGYVFVTRNGRFVRASREYCINSRLTSVVQQGPLIHQRELATLAWLRTGLGAEEDKIPRSHLLATCDRVLHIRSEVPRAVAAILKQVTPEKLEQFELLLLDQRGIRKLADETLNNENVVTADNATQLLELMRRATVEEERQKFTEELNVRDRRHREAQRKANSATRMAEASAETAAVERDAAVAEINRLKRREREILQRVADSTNVVIRAVDKALVWAFVAVFLLACVNFFTSWLTDSIFWKAILAFGGVLGLYYLISDILGKRKIGATHLLDFLAMRLISWRIDELDLAHVSLDDFEIGNASIRLKDCVPSAATEAVSHGDIFPTG